MDHVVAHIISMQSHQWQSGRSGKQGGGGGEGGGNFLLEHVFDHITFFFI